MLRSLKDTLYFPLASYLKLLASVKLMRWKPRVIVVTGSVGKTTLFELLKSQISKDEAYFAEHVNSAYGIPINILGLNPASGSILSWISLFMHAIPAVFAKMSSQKIYITEADVDRPGEGKFLSELLLPEITVWVSSTNTHSANFDKLITQKKFGSVEEAIAFEYGYFAQNTSKLVIANLDYSTEKKRLERTQADIVSFSKKGYLQKYEITEKGTIFQMEDERYEFKSILPESAYFSILATKKMLDYLSLPFDKSFKNFHLPPGRGSIFKGVKRTTIIDSSYNSSPSAVIDSLNALDQLARYKQKKVFLMGDMRELGNEAKEEHERVAKKINETVDFICCVGPLTQQYVMPNIKSSIQSHWFPTSKLAGEFLKRETPEEAVILVKGSQNGIFLEEAIKELLASPEDAEKLCRQEKHWLKVKNSLK